MDYRQARRQQAEQLDTLRRARATTGRQSSPTLFVWRLIRDEMLMPLLGLLLLVGLPWLLYPEERGWFRVLVSLVIALLLAALVALFVLSVIVTRAAVL